MQTETTDQTTTRQVLAAMAGLLETPLEDFEARLERAHRLAAQVDMAASERLHVLSGELAPLTLGERQELHASTFDLNPACVLYLSVHLFGEESFKRAKLMTGLDETYQAAGYSRGAELPDHLAVILRFSPHFSDEEWRELMHYCLPEPVAKMTESLRRLKSPYGHLLEAIEGLLASERMEEARHA